jgi:sec-independent protein translocase protein TatB
MFGIDFFEFMVIAVVALIVLGPERLPKVARTVGLLLGRFQRYVNDVKADINREIHLEELKRLQSEVTETAQRIESNVRQEFDSAKTTVASSAAAAVAELDAAAQSLQQASATVTADAETATAITTDAAASSETPPERIFGDTTLSPEALARAEAAAAEAEQAAATAPATTDATTVRPADPALAQPLPQTPV